MKILLVDDHALFRDGLRYVLQQMDEQVTIEEAQSSSEALSIVEKAPDLDLVLLDLGLPGMDGFGVLKILRERYPGIPVVIVSASSYSQDVRRALDMGAMGFIPKSSTSQVMLSALRLVFSGGVYLPPALLEESDQLATYDNSFGFRRSEDTAAELTRLGFTERQIQVLKLMAQGQSNKHIARALNVAEGTVKIHVTAILKALNVSNRSQAIIAASRLGITGEKTP